MIKNPTNFPSPTEKARMETLQKFNKLYQGEHFSVFGLHELIKKQFKKPQDLIYIAQNLTGYISDFYGDFVAGDIDKMIIRGNTGNAEVDKFVDDVVYENDLKEQVPDMGTDQSIFGFVLLLGWLDTDGGYHISKVGQDQYFPQADGSVIFTTYKSVTPVNSTEAVLYCLTQHYYLENGTCKVDREGWVANKNGTLEKKISFEEITNIFGLNMVENENLEIDELPIRIANNTRLNSYGFGKSDYNDIMPQISEINERVSHIATQLLKNLDAKMALPATDNIDENGDMKNGAFDTIEVNKDEIMPQYIVNTNNLLTDAREHISDQIKMVSEITSVPMWQLTKSSMPERVESLRIQLFATMRKTSRKRAKIIRALQDMFRIGFKMKGINFADDIEIAFSDVVPVDELTQANTEQIKIMAGISSKKSAIMRVENMDEADAEAELKQIQDEDRIAGGLPQIQ